MFLKEKYLGVRSIFTQAFQRRSARGQNDLEMPFLNLCLLLLVPLIFLPKGKVRIIPPAEVRHTPRGYRVIEIYH